jgi:hypothetical protein
MRTAQGEADGIRQHAEVERLVFRVGDGSRLHHSTSGLTPTSVRIDHKLFDLEQ